MLFYDDLFLQWKCYLYSQRHVRFSLYTLFVFAVHYWVCGPLWLWSPSYFHRAAAAALQPWKDCSDTHQYEQLQLHLEELRGLFECVCAPGAIKFLMITLCLIDKYSAALLLCVLLRCLLLLFLFKCILKIYFITCIHFLSCEFILDFIFLPVVQHQKQLLMHLDV